MRKMPAQIPLPKELLSKGKGYWDDFLEAARSYGAPVSKDPYIIDIAIRVWAFSEFVARSCIRDPRTFLDLLEKGDLERSYMPGDYDRLIRHSLREVQSYSKLGIILRRLRRREMVRIAWRDLAGWADLNETVGDLSSLAGACLRQGLDLLHQWQSQRLSPGDSISQSLVVLGMGKLGGRELNFSSDIDLIFACQDPVNNEEYYTRLCHRLIDLIGAVTSEGMVFRVDMRLRPYGEAGPLVMGMSAMEEYYQDQGRDWERYAMIKARPVAGNVEAGDRLLRALRPFIYRRYLDYGAFDSLRKMKRLIVHEAQKRGARCDIKLGTGGIREIEFIVQTLQLIHGGRVPELQERGMLRCLDLLSKSGLLPEEACRDLGNAYRFLRNTEHRLQEYADQQTQSLPTGHLSRMRLAASMGFLIWEDFIEALHGHMDRVHQHFERLFSRPDSQGKDPERQVLTDIWLGIADRDQAEGALCSMGFQESHRTLHLLQALKGSRKTLALTASGRDILDRLVPLILKEASRADQPDLALKRLLDLIESIERRTCYLSLILENPSVLSVLTRLCSKGAWIATLISRQPILLDELLAPQALYSPPGRPDLEATLERLLSRIATDDLEQQMDELRRFRQAAMLRVAAADISGGLTVQEVSDHLTDIAEVVIEKVLAIAWGQMTRRHGVPGEDRGGVQGFAVIAYGKLGGREMGYSSDLDLVFLYSDRVGQVTCGPSPIDSAMFYSRLGQRMIHILTVHTQAGVLYKVDVRLRPSGSSGVLVSSLRAFSGYQADRAWTWEHQALVRARAIAGDSGICGEFEELRRHIITSPRDPMTLRDSVRAMRDRLIDRRTDRFDLKYGPGGLIDIEFLIQYMVLANAHRHPDLAEWRNDTRLIETFRQRELMPKSYTDILIEASVDYRKKINQLGLQERLPLVEADALLEQRSAVQKIWNEIMGLYSGARGRSRTGTKDSFEGF